MFLTVFNGVETLYRRQELIEKNSCTLSKLLSRRNIELHSTEKVGGSTFEKSSERFADGGILGGDDDIRNCHGGGF